MNHTVEWRKNSVCWRCRKKRKTLEKHKVAVGSFYAYVFLCPPCKYGWEDSMSKTKEHLTKAGMALLTGLGLAGLVGVAIKMKQDYDRIQKRHKKEEEEDAELMRKLSGKKIG